MSTRKTVSIKGMTCRACEIRLSEGLASVSGVESVDVDHRRGVAVVTGADSVTDETLRSAVRDSGYEVGPAEALPWLNRRRGLYRDLAASGAVIAALYWLFKSSGVLTVNFAPDSVDLSVAFVVGIIGGLSTCMAMVGGLVLALAAKYAQANQRLSTWDRFRPHVSFNVGRLVGFGFFGALLGVIGSVIRLSPPAVAVLTILVGGTMLLLGLNMTDVSPRLRSWVVALPASWSRALGFRGSYDGGYSDAGAALAGALTFFLPCGFTQAMQVYAVASGSAVGGALIMTAFAFGAAPPLIGIGGIASALKGRAGRLFFVGAGLLVLVMGGLNLKNGVSLLVAGLDSGAAVVETAVDENEVQVIRTVQSGSGYLPREQTVKRGRPVRWIIVSKTQFTCSSSIVIPQLGISRSLVLGENVIEFTPTESVDISFSCASGVFDGRVHVVD